jgi:thiamine-phosphate pyrophosphorylase
MVTDRRRVGARWEETLPERVGAAARAGVDVIQVREHDLDGRSLTRLVERCVLTVRHTRARIIVNDRMDVALVAGAHGVHLRGDSVPAARARAMTSPEFLIGRSVRSAAEAAHAEEEGGLNYLVFGTVFATSAKPWVTDPAGLHALADVVSATRLPVLAVGGMSRATLPGVGGTGAAGFAAIGLFADVPADHLPATVQQAVAAFDSARGVP